MFLILGMGLGFLLPRHIDHVRSGLDPSWVYAINVAHGRGWKFGEDILFTHGPLGFLSSTCSVGRNIEIVLLVTGVLFFSQLWLLGRSLVLGAARKAPTGRMLAAGLLLWAIPRPPFESYLLYVVLLALSVAWFDERKRGYFAWACALTALQTFVKFTGAFACGSAVGLFWAIWFFKDRAAWRRIGWIPFLIPIAFVAGHLLHYPSWTGLWKYLRAAGELAAGHSVAMSLAEEPLYTWLILAAGAGYAVYLAVLACRDRPQAQYALMFGGAMGVTVKHGLVRPDMWHLDAALCAALPMFSLMLLFDIRGRRPAARRWLAPLAVGGLLLGILLVGRGQAVAEAKAYFRVVYEPNWSRLASLPGVIDKLTHPRPGSDPLPAEFLREIGTNAVAFYPLELSLAAFNDVELKPMPVLQAYAAYTPVLDGFNAGFFRDDGQAPAFVVLSLRTIDGRWPLIESPLAWTALFEGYDVAATRDPFLLLKRRDEARRLRFRELSADVVGTDRDIALPEVAGPVFVSAELALNWRGRLAKFFCKIPPVNLRAAFQDGRVVEGRCLPDNLKSKTLVSFLPLPFALRSTAGFIRTGEGTNRVRRLVLGGPGLAYYGKTMRVALFEGYAPE